MQELSEETTTYPPRRTRSASPASDEGGTGWPTGRWTRGMRIPNEGSTARERNFLSWVKLTLYLVTICVALLLRFQLGQANADKPRFQFDSETPLGVLFFVAALASVSIGTSSYFGVTADYFRRKGFAYAGRVVDACMLGIGLLIVAACILLLVAN